MKYLILLAVLCTAGCGCGGPDITPGQAEELAEYHKQMFEYYDGLVSLYNAQSR